MFHEIAITCFELHPTQKVVVSGDSDGAVCICNYETGKVTG